MSENKKKYGILTQKILLLWCRKPGGNMEFWLKEIDYQSGNSTEFGSFWDEKWDNWKETKKEN